jgi:hypothetical protein
MMYQRFTARSAANKCKSGMERIVASLLLRLEVTEADGWFGPSVKTQ